MRLAIAIKRGSARPQRRIKKVPAPSGGYLMDHSTMLFLLGSDGGYLDHYGRALSIDEIAGRAVAKLQTMALGGVRGRIVEFIGTLRCKHVEAIATDSKSRHPRKRLSASLQMADTLTINEIWRS